MDYFVWADQREKQDTNLMIPESRDTTSILGKYHIWQNFQVEKLLQLRVKMVIYWKCLQHYTCELTCTHRHRHTQASKHVHTDTQTDTHTHIDVANLHNITYVTYNNFRR